jgi:hypothetical protein
MSNPQGPGKQGRKDAKSKAPQQQQAAGAPGRSAHQQSGQSARPSHEQGSAQQQRPSHSSHPMEMEDEE